MKRHLQFIITFVVIGLTTVLILSATKSKLEFQKQDYSLSLADSLITVDSVKAFIWYEDQLKKDIVTIKIYCTSGYPKVDCIEFNDLKYLCIYAQSVFQVGAHYKADNKSDWLNRIRYEFKTEHSFSFSGSGVNDDVYIKINSIDKKNNLISFNVKLLEYIPINEFIENYKIQRRSVVFKGENIPYIREEY